jgi:MoaA/NifB/PqqE/SkfB family radical SAM enzyme
MEPRAVRRASGAPTMQGVKLIFELTNLCNFSCVHCIRDEEGPKHYLPVAIVAKVLAEAQAYQQVRIVAFTGGSQPCTRSLPTSSSL